MIWVGTDDGTVQITQDAGETWTLLNDNIPSNPEYWVSRVEASHHELGTAYVSFTGYRNDDFRPFVYRTTDFGETWTSIASNLPPGPVNVIREHHENPDLLFVGTEFQVWVSNDGGRAWTSLKLDMPTNPVHDMKIQERDDDLVVATHGRGIYVADIAPLSELTPEVLAREAHFFEPEPEIRWIGADFTNYASSNFEGESEEPGASLYYYLRDDASGDVTFTVYQGSVPITEIEGETTAGIHSVQWDLFKRVERSEAEREALREAGGRGGGFGRGGPSPAERMRYAITEAPPGEYRVVLSIDGRDYEQTVEIVKDEWWADRR